MKTEATTEPHAIYSWEYVRSIISIMFAKNVGIREYDGQIS
jgi:hypothetical protein